MQVERWSGVITSLRRGLEGDSWARALIVGSVALAVVSLVGIVVDARVVDEAPVWLKPLKFAMSTVIYMLTLGWICANYSGHRLIRWAVRAQAVLLAFELVLISLQAARGVRSHFNIATPLDLSIFSAMGLAIGAVGILMLIVCLAVAWQRRLPVLLHRAAVAGLLLSVVGMFAGYRMTSPTASQLAGFSQNKVEAVGSHHVGPHKPGSGLPVVGWSTTAGDWRLMHFVGLHGLQLLLLLAAALQPLQTSGRTWPSVLLWVAIVVTVGLFISAFMRTSLGLPGPI